MAQLISRAGRTGVTIPDYRDLIKTMKTVNPALVTQMRKDFRKVGRPLAREVSRGIPKTPPTSGIHINRPQHTVSGFTPRVVPGRLTWAANRQNRGIKPEHTIVKLPRVRNKFRNGAMVSSIARVDADNAAVVMADMAGKSGKWVNKRSETRPYLYSRSAPSTGKYGTSQRLITTRTHKINGQGKAMIRALNKKGSPSRFIYPAAEKSLPAVRYEAGKVMYQVIQNINQELKMR
jgi:hypothetical protein